MEATLTKKPEEVVLDFISFLNLEDFDAAREQLSSDMVFNGVMGSRDGAEAYMNDMKKMKFKYEIKKIVADDSDACVLYEIDMSGKKLLCSGWYHVHSGKINSFTVLFDPRPLLEGSDKK